MSKIGRTTVGLEFQIDHFHHKNNFISCQIKRANWFWGKISSNITLAGDGQGTMKTN
jgi:hypothetical protein